MLDTELEDWDVDVGRTVVEVVEVGARVVVVGIGGGVEDTGAAKSVSVW